ncbi:MAG: SDR family NAD(P)-dependent oxidoreductase [Leptolyngbya sp. SIOISBB]|nr:SDR family NAD(P)-dependent oxidoreductase [Leptolyngbya sp. SIOISBB]
MSQHIVITGVSRGLGRAMTETFIAAGHRVSGCARSAEAIAQLRTMHSDSHLFDVLDVRDDASVSQWCQKVLQKSGTPDRLINNAGLINAPAPLWEVPAEECQAVIDVNIHGTVNMIRHFVPPMRQQRRGIVVNFSSGWGRSTSPGVAPYCATKWAIEGLTQALAQELPDGMAAVALNPGIIHTKMLEACFGEAAADYTPLPVWAQAAVPFILEIRPQDNGRSLAVPG